MSPSSDSYFLVRMLATCVAAQRRPTS